MTQIKLIKIGFAVIIALLVAVLCVCISNNHTNDNTLSNSVKLDSLINSNKGQIKQIKQSQDELLLQLYDIENSKETILHKYHEKVITIERRTIDNPKKFGDSLFDLLAKRDKDGYFNPPAIKVD